MLPEFLMHEEPPSNVKLANLRLRLHHHYCNELTCYCADDYGDPICECGNPAYACNQDSHDTWQGGDSGNMEETFRVPDCCLPGELVR